MQSKLLVLTTALISLLNLLSSGAAENKPGNWETLFDGKSTAKWRGYKRDAFPDKGWKAENGALKTIVGGDVVDIVTKEKYDNFELELEWKISPAGNSGVMYRVSEAFDEPWNTGPEMQVLDDAKHADGQNPKTSAGALYALVAPVNKTLKPVGEWNTTRIVVNGNHVEHWLNGKKVVEYELDSKALQDLIAGSKFSDKPRFAKEPSGYIVLQHHTDEVWYRNIRVRRLGSAAAANTTDNQLTATEKAAGWKLL